MFFSPPLLNSSSSSSTLLAWLETRPKLRKLGWLNQANLSTATHHHHFNSFFSKKETKPPELIGPFHLLFCPFSITISLYVMSYSMCLLFLLCHVTQYMHRVFLLFLPQILLVPLALFVEDGTGSEEDSYIF